MREQFVCKSPVGYIYCSFTGGALSSLDIRPRGRVPAGRFSPEQKRLRDELDDYFSGKGQAFTQPLRFSSGTPFQQQVWRMLLTIPFGETRSYQWLAESVGRPKAARAVGQAVGKNPLPLIVPCHRIIAFDGSLGGFSCGLPVKKWLLKHEKSECGMQDSGRRCPGGQFALHPGRSHLI
ncbi:MAG TPA: methylated-DNA--[protein]-cysteine S-methyltransferase [Dissulfurispiraceae bacterium]|nr:methylated-DNA--[protein]-cysteine S-methyltransferase [Dissulfurispiraceae bacterium]